MASDEENKKKAAPRKLFTDFEQHKPVVVKVAVPKHKIANDLNATKPVAVPQKLFRSLDQPAPKRAKRKPKLIENI